MKLFKTDDDFLINPKCIVMIGPVLYNQTSEKYYFKIYLNATDVDITNKTKEYTMAERYRLIDACEGK